ncbi:hypothetical protein T265_12302 [Opisthorchis viverrini]|uniref:Uncharacterized protein n=1 Tax=Opisthorchis viverrini TaxID=6198 RepID=A0A074Z4V0_OPIVI|nr:hypothetical protein T265_12302 [Opisthorchis viverrini]KER18335.1 hypothetical protein T265_12302 [Opisthorchis viverrini]
MGELAAVSNKQTEQHDLEEMRPHLATRHDGGGDGGANQATPTQFSATSVWNVTWTNTCVYLYAFLILGMHRV